MYGRKGNESLVFCSLYVDWAKQPQVDEQIIRSYWISMFAHANFVKVSRRLIRKLECCIYNCKSNLCAWSMPRSVMSHWIALSFLWHHASMAQCWPAANVCRSRPSGITSTHSDVNDWSCCGALFMWSCCIALGNLTWHCASTGSKLNGIN